MPNGEEGFPPGVQIPELEQSDPGPGRPGRDFPGPLEQASDTYKMLYAFLVDLGTPSFIARFVAALVGSLVLVGAVLFTVAVWTLVKLGTPVAQAGLQLIDRTRRELSPAAAVLAADAVNELTGANLSAADLPTGKSFEDQLARAHIIGSRIHEFLLREFAPAGTVSPEQGLEAAARFTGFVTNFGISTAMLSIVAELETLGAIETFRELGVNLAENLALGRLHRLAMRPLITETITTPLGWALNKRYQNTLLSPAQAIKAWMRGELAERQLHEELSRQGYSAERINALIVDTRRVFGVDEMSLAVRYGARTRQEALAQLVRSGYSEDDAVLALDLEDLKRVDAFIRQHIALLVDQRTNGVLDSDQFRAALEPLPITDRERETLRRVTEARLEMPRRFLSFAQMRDALVEGVIEPGELLDFLNREGYSRDDAQILLILSLLRLAEREQAEKLRAERQAARERKRKAETPTPPEEAA